MELTFYYNGELLKSTELYISAFDQAFLYGEGLYEPLIVRNRKMLLSQEHFDRFLSSAEALKMDLKVTGSMLEKTIMTLLDLNSMDDAMVRLIATRGDSSGYYYEDLYSIPSLLIMTLPLRLFSEKLYMMGVTLKTAQWRDIPSFSFPSDQRTLSIMNRRLCYREAREKNHFDALMLNLEGYMTQCTGSNIFLLKGRTLTTPDLTSGIFPGVMRENILSSIARELNLDLYEGFILINQLFDADESFIASTEAGVLPVISCDGRRIGNGRPGRVTKKVQEFFSEWYKGG
jgi:branched-chain amino acid aminotransferase